MRKFFFWLVGLPFAILIAIFAAANTEKIAVQIYPFMIEVQLPIYVLSLGFLAVGLVIGAVLMWISVVNLKVKVYNKDLEIKNLKRSLDRSVIEHQKLLEKADKQTRALPPAA